jgi:hypothetical protein
MIDNLLYCVQEIVLKQFKNYKMENLKNIVMSSEFISLFITNGIIFAVILVIISRYKTRVKFYQAVLEGDYIDLLHFLMLTNTSKQKRICYPFYSDYIKRGLGIYFDSRLNVTVTSSRLTRIQDFIDVAIREVEKNAPHLRNNDSYWGPIHEKLKRVISYCGPNYFASCYVTSLVKKGKEESYARSFLLQFYNECGNSKDENLKKQFEKFIELVNEEIEECQKYDSPQDEKDFLMSKKISVGKEKIESTKFWISTH